MRWETVDNLGTLRPYGHLARAMFSTIHSANYYY